MYMLVFFRPQKGMLIFKDNRYLQNFEKFISLQNIYQ